MNFQARQYLEGAPPPVKWISVLDRCVENSEDPNLQSLSSQVFAIELLFLHTWRCSSSEHQQGILHTGFLSFIEKVDYIASRIYFKLLAVQKPKLEYIYGFSPK